MPIHHVVFQVWREQDTGCTVTCSSTRWRSTAASQPKTFWKGPCRGRSTCESTPREWWEQMTLCQIWDPPVYPPRPSLSSAKHFRAGIVGDWMSCIIQSVIHYLAGSVGMVWVTRDCCWLRFPSTVGSLSRWDCDREGPGWPAVGLWLWILSCTLAFHCRRPLALLVVLCWPSFALCHSFH